MPDKVIATTEKVIEVAKASDTLIQHSHPFLGMLYENLTLVGIVVAALLAIASPIVKLIQKTNSSANNTINKNDTESFLYVHLKEQIELHKIELERSREENKRLWEMIRGLEARLSKLEHVEHNFKTLKISLVEKTAIITAKETEIDILTRENYELKTDNVLKAEQITHLHELLSRSFGVDPNASP